MAEQVEWNIYVLKVNFSTAKKGGENELRMLFKQ